MATLTNTKIKDTYDGLLKTTNNEAIGASGVTLIEDGLGNASALSVGRSGNGITVSGTITGNLSGNVTGNVTGTVLTAAQTNITSVGTLSSLAVSGNLTVDTNTLYVDAASDSVSINDSVTANVPLTVTTNSGYEDVLYLKSSGTNIDSRISMFPTGTGNAVINAGTNSLEFQTAGSEKMRIDSSGNVGIGIVPTSVGNYKVLELNGTSTDGGYISLYSSGTQQAEIYSNSGGLNFTSLGATYTRFYTNGEERMRIDSSGQIITGGDINLGNETSGRKNLIINSADNGAAITFRADATTRARIEVPDGETSLVFGVESASTPTERMRITSGGDVYVGTQSSLHSEAVFHIKQNNTSSGNNACAAMQNQNAASGGGVYTVVFLNNVGSITGSIGQTVSSTSYSTSSDYRLKENVVPMEGALDRVDALKPSRFNFIADPEKTVDGFLAHEVAEVIPEAITGEKDAVDEEGNPVYQGIDQSKIVPLLVGAIQELSAKVAALESQLNA